MKADFVSFSPSLCVYCLVSSQPSVSGRQTPTGSQGLRAATDNWDWDTNHKHTDYRGAEESQINQRTLSNSQLDLDRVGSRYISPYLGKI